MIEATDRRRFLVGGAALATAAAAVAAEPRRGASTLADGELAQLIPLQVAERQGLDDPSVVPERVDGSGATGQTVSRRYTTASGPAIMLVATYHGSRSPELRVHRPETCYAVAGFSVGSVHAARIPMGAEHALPAVAFLAQRGDRRERVLYWTRVGAEFPQTLESQRLAFVRQALEGYRADGLLMRLSVIEEAWVGNSACLASFGAALLRAVSPPARRLLAGPLTGILA